MGTTLRSLLFVAAVLGLGVVAAPAQAGFDDLPGETLNDTPYSSVTPFDATTPAFYTEHFTVEPAEHAEPASFLGCEAYGARDSWVRFATAVKGNLRVNAVTDTPGDIFYIVYTAPTTTASFGDLKFVGCTDGFDGKEETYVYGHEIPAGQVAYVQVLVQCTPMEPPCTEEQEDDAQGGETTVRLRFKPDNADGDSFPDTLDGCPAVAGAFGGCPDGDGDGVGDAADHCPGEFGRGSDGCRLADEDGDGHSALTRGGDDCNDDDPAIHPGARDVPGNKVDENCDGRDSPYPRVQNEVRALVGWSPRLGRNVGFLRPFKVVGPFVKGMSVKLLCSKKSCPVTLEVAPVHPGAEILKIGKGLAGKTLEPGAVVTVIVTRPGYVGEARVYTIRPHGKLTEQKLCVPPGAQGPPRKCP